MVGADRSKNPTVEVPADDGEPNALSDEQRRELVGKAEAGKITAEETRLLADDVKRAMKKANLAAKQVAHPDDPQSAVFAGPANRAESATESLSQMTPVLIDIAVKYKRDRQGSGTAGGNKQKENAAPRHRQILAAARRLQQAGVPDRTLARELHEQFELSTRHLRTILQAGGILQVPKRK